MDTEPKQNLDPNNTPPAVVADVGAAPDGAQSEDYSELFSAFAPPATTTATTGTPPAAATSAPADAAPADEVSIQEQINAKLIELFGTDDLEEIKNTKSTWETKVTEAESRAAQMQAYAELYESAPESQKAHLEIMAATQGDDAVRQVWEAQQEWAALVNNMAATVGNPNETEQRKLEEQLLVYYKCEALAAQAIDPSTGRPYGNLKNVQDAYSHYRATIESLPQLRRDLYEAEQQHLPAEELKHYRNLLKVAEYEIKEFTDHTRVYANGIRNGTLFGLNFTELRKKGQEKLSEAQKIAKEQVEIRNKIANTEGQFIKLRKDLATGLEKLATSQTFSNKNLNPEQRKSLAAAITKVVVPEVNKMRYDPVFMADYTDENGKVDFETFAINRLVSKSSKIGENNKNFLRQAYGIPDAIKAKNVSRDGLPTPAGSSQPFSAGTTTPKRSNNPVDNMMGERGEDKYQQTLQKTLAEMQKLKERRQLQNA